MNIFKKVGGMTKNREQQVTKVTLLFKKKRSNHHTMILTNVMFNVLPYDTKDSHEEPRHSPRLERRRRHDVSTTGRTGHSHGAFPH